MLTAGNGRVWWTSWAAGIEKRQKRWYFGGAVTMNAVFKRRRAAKYRHTALLRSNGEWCNNTAKLYLSAACVLWRVKSFNNTGAYSKRRWIWSHDIETASGGERTSLHVAPKIVSYYRFNIRSYQSLQYRLDFFVTLKRQAVAPERIWMWGRGAPIRHKVPEKFYFWSCPSTFLALKAQLVVLVSAFVTVSTVWSVYCLLFFYSRCPLCPAICKSEGLMGHVPPCPMESAPLAGMFKFVTEKTAYEWKKYAYIV